MGCFCACPHSVKSGYMLQRDRIGDSIDQSTFCTKSCKGKNSFCRLREVTAMS